MDNANITQPNIRKQGPTIKQRLVVFFTDIYKIHRFVLRFFKEAFLPPYEFKEIVRYFNNSYRLYCRAYIYKAIAAFPCKLWGQFMAAFPGIHCYYACTGAFGYSAHSIG